MPAEVSSVEWSSARGTSGQDGSRLWPFDSKKERKPSRSSADVRTKPIVRLASAGLIGGLDETTAVPQGRAGSPRMLRPRSRPYLKSVRTRPASVASRRPGAPPREAMPRQALLGGAPVGHVVGRDLRADLLERAADEPGDVHLRDSDLLRDLRLRKALEEAQVEDAALAFVERTQPRGEHGAVFAHLVFVLDLAERLERVEIRVAVAGGGGRKREGRVCLAALPRPEDLFLFHSRRLGEVGDRRRALKLHRELLEQVRQADVQLLEPTRDAHRPALVAEVALDLADDVRRGVGGELDAALDVEAVDRLDEPDRADLDEVLELLAAVRVAPRQRPHERHVLLDQLLARSEVQVLVVAAEECAVALLGHQPAPASTFFVSPIQAASSRSSISTRS